MKNHLFLSLVAFQVFGCSILKSEDQSPTFHKREYVGAEFRTDGYYYNQFHSDSSGKQVERLEIVFYNRNGITFYGGSPTLSEVEEYEIKYRDGTFYSKWKNYRLYWSIFKVQNDTIVDEGWVNPNGTHLTVREICMVLNDTTLIRVSSEVVYTGEKQYLDDTLRFKKFDFKPDSVPLFSI